VQPWRGPTPLTEAAILGAFAAEGLRPYRWANGPGDVYAAHSHPYHKVIIVVTGSITFGFPGGDSGAILSAGDRLELPPGVAHNAVVGAHGVVCLEAHRPG
jgi:quercetin dioxygenase-like cupin family protein